MAIRQSDFYDAAQLHRDRLPLPSLTFGLHGDRDAAVVPFFSKTSKRLGMLRSVSVLVIKNWRVPSSYS